MKLRSIVISLLLALIFSCVNKENERKLEKIEKKEIIVIEKIEETKKEIEEIQKEQEKIEETKKEIEEIQKEKDNKMKLFENDLDIFRYGYKKRIKLKEPNLDIENVNFEKYILTEDSIIFGDEKKLKLNLFDFKEIFKANKNLPSIYEGEKLNPIQREIIKNKKYVAFTFDDGPNDKYHILIRDYFSKINETATFFVTGINAKKYPKILKETYLQGHEILNHSYNHPNFIKLKDEEVLKEFFLTNDEIYRITGDENKYIRPPYGSFDTRVINLLGGKKNIALWNIDSMDWKYRNKEVIIKRVLNEIKDKDIVLFHDTVKETYEAILYMIPILKERGYQFVSYSDMIKIRNERRK